MFGFVCAIDPLRLLYERYVMTGSDKPPLFIRICDLSYSFPLFENPPLAESGHRAGRFGPSHRIRIVFFSGANQHNYFAPDCFRAA